MALALKLALVALSVLLASLAARRFGHAVGGTIAGLPMIAGPIMGFLLLQQTPAQVHDIAVATLVCLPATVLHLLSYAWSVARWHWRWPAALLLANMVFVCAGAALLWRPAPDVVVFALALFATLAGPHAMPRLKLVPGAVAIPRVELALRVAAAMAMALALIRGAAVMPAGASGLLLAIPITGNVLPCFTLPRHGSAATVALLAGFVRGLLGFASFFITLGFGLQRWPVGVAYALAWAAALAAVGAAQAVRLRARSMPA